MTLCIASISFESQLELANGQLTSMDILVVYIMVMDASTLPLPNFAVVIPTFREVENLKWLLPKILNLYPSAKVIVIDDSSEDGTDELIAKLQNTFSPNRLMLETRSESPSYARSLLKGIQIASTLDVEKILQMDADGSHPVEEISTLIKSSSNVAIGSRYIKGSKVVDVPPIRRVISRLGNYYLNFRVSIPVADKTNGFRAFDLKSIRVLESLESTQDGFSIQIDVLKHLAQFSTTFEEHPTIFRYRNLGDSKFNMRKVIEALNLTRQK
jgi:dolichol-phosphate mannosyltransferase